MTPRQAHALATPLAAADLSPTILAPYTVDQRVPGDRGLLLRSILAVDR